MLTDSSTSAKVELPQKSLRQCAAESAAFRREMAERERQASEADGRRVIAESFTETLRVRLHLDIDPGAVEFRDGTPLLRVNDADGEVLLFTFTPRRSDFEYGRFPACLSLAWVCAAGHVNASTNIDDFADLGERLDDVQAWEDGTRPCCYCEKEWREERKSAEPRRPRPKTAAEKLAEGLTEFVREIVDEAREEA